MKTGVLTLIRSFLLLLALAAGAGSRTTLDQTAAELDLHLYAGLTITGAVGTVYQVLHTTDVAASDHANAWRCLDFLQLPSSPYLWTDKSTPATGRRFYQAVPFAASSNLVFIPPGTFRMGSATNEEGRSVKEGPQTEVTLSRGFWISKYLVTQGEYQGLIGSNPSFFNANGYGVDLRRPVDSTSWFEATAYCAQFTRQESAAGNIPSNCVYRLPTEAEWEYACRACTSTRFSYGDDPGYANLSNYAWYHVNSGGTTHPVGQKLPNPWGLYDMHGSLEEWCQDWYALYPGGRVLDPQGPDTGSLRVIRGGFWEDTGGYCRSASRNVHDPGAQHYHLGFRVVLAVDKP